MSAFDTKTDTLEPADEELALLLAGGMSTAEAAGEFGCSLSTVKRRNRDRAFRARVRELRELLTARALGTLSGAQAAAARTLARLMRTARSEQVQLRAAVAILETAAKLRENTELADTLARLEALLREEGDGESDLEQSEAPAGGGDGPEGNGRPSPRDGGDRLQAQA